MTVIRTRSSHPLDWLDGARNTALFLDFDGTLIDVAASPEGVQVPHGLPALLEGLREALGGALAILTGRAIADVDRLLAPGVFVAAGVHGAEYRTSHAEIVRPAALPLDADLARRLTELEARHPGVRVEDKGATAAVHWREVPHAAEAVKADLADILGDGPDHLELRHGRRVFEIVPRHVSKGAALEILSGLPDFAGRRPIMIGDDFTDESAFLAAERAGGVGFRVAGETFPTEVADFASPRLVREWLSVLLARASHRP